MAANAIRDGSTRTVPMATLLAGAAVGCGLSIFGLVLPWLAASVAALVGVAHGRSRALMFLALGLALGGLAYIALGLFWNLVDDPSSLSGGG